MKIKTIIVSLFALMAAGFATTQAQAQDVFAKGQNTVSLGIGLFGNYGGTLQVPPLQATYEYCVVDGLINGNNGSIGIGAMGAYYRVGEQRMDAKWSVNGGLLGARGSFHYQFVGKLDTYAGIFLGARMTGTNTTVAVGDYSTDVQSSSSVSSAFSWGLHLGARYYFTPAFAATAEVGYGYSILNLGITFRF